MTFRVPPLLAAALLAPPALAQAPRAPAPPAGPPALPVAALQTLDKITGRVSTLEVTVGEPARVGTLTVTVRTCRKRPPEEPPEAAAFLEIDEKRGAEEPKRLFTGWMFESSPAISALEHPVYDVRLLDCRAARR